MENQIRTFSFLLTEIDTEIDTERRTKYWAAMPQLKIEVIYHFDTCVNLVYRHMEISNIIFMA